MCTNSVFNLCSREMVKHHHQEVSEQLAAGSDMR